jgi:hypothetical protein
MRFAGFALLAGALTLVLHAYRPGSFDPDRIVPEAIHAKPAATQVAAAPARNFSLNAEPTLKSLQERARLRQARAAEAMEPAPVGVPVAMLPAAAPVVAPARTVAEPMSVLAPQDDAGRAALVLSIKRELRRVGCFGGRLDDDWDANAKWAADTFMDRVNATLPNKPDHVLLALVRNHKAAACDGSCPRGQAMSTEGRCMPNAIVAKMTRGTPASADARKLAVAEPFTTTVTVAEVQTTAARTPAPVETSVRASKKPPLPGRMAMGSAGSGSEAAGNWWDGFMSPTRETQPGKEQTLDRPVGLTHVPTPRAAPRAAPAAAEMRTASVAEDLALGDGPALQPAAIAVAPRERALPPRKTRSYRTYRGKSARPRPMKARYARRWSGRNVQVMFQHPLGRM